MAANRRLFVALETPEAVRRRVAALQRELGARGELASRVRGPARARAAEPAGGGRPSAADVRWVPIRDLHTYDLTENLLDRLREMGVGEDS